MHSLDSEKQKSTFSRPSGIASFGIALGFILVAYAVFGLPYYETCDDILLTSIVCGAGFVDVPDPHILYSNFLIGIVLSELYKFFPEFTWYGLYLISSQLIAIAVIIFTIEGKFTSKLKFLPIILFLLTCIRPVLLVQFTTTACLVATAASALLLTGLEHIKRKEKTKVNSIFAVLLFLWSSMIRIESFYLVLALTLVIVALKQIQRFNLDQIKLTGLVVASSLVLVFAQVTINQEGYKNDKGWNQTYQQIKASWSLINTYRLHGKDAQTKNALKEANWTNDDIFMLQSWYLLDPKFSNAKLIELDKKIPKINPTVDLLSFGETLFETITDRTVAPNILILTVFMILLAQARFSNLSASIYLTTVLMIIAYLVYFSKFPPRVMASILQTSTVAFLLYSSPKEINRLIGSRNKLLAAITIATIFLSPSLLNFHKLTSTAKLKRTEIKQFTDKLSKKKDALYVLWGAYFPYKYISPYDNLSSYFGNLKLLGFNSLVVSPIFEKRLSEFKFDSFIDELDKKNVYHVIENYTQVLLESYLVNKKGIFPQFNVEEVDKNLGLAAFKVTLSEPKVQFEPPEFDSSSLIVFPGDYEVKAEEMDLVAVDDVDAIYKLKGRRPLLITDLKSKPVAIKDYSEIMVELKLAKTKIPGRKLCFGIGVNNDDGHYCFVTTKLDDNFHRYSYNLDRLFLQPEDKITGLYFFPIFEKTVNKGEKLTIRRIGFKPRKTTENTSDILIDSP